MTDPSAILLFKAVLALLASVAVTQLIMFLESFNDRDEDDTD